MEESGGSVGRLTLIALALIAVVVLARAVWVFVTAYIRGALFPAVR